MLKYRITVIKLLPEPDNYGQYPIGTNQILKVYKDWCTECVGRDNFNYYGFNKNPPFEFKFRFQEDLLAFKLKFNV